MYITSKIIFLQFYVYQYKESNSCKEIHAKISYVIIWSRDLGVIFFNSLYISELFYELMSPTRE